MSTSPLQDQLGNVSPGAGTARIALISLIVGGLALIAAILLSHGAMGHFYFAYLVSFCFFLSLSLGALFFVLLQHLTQAGWSVGVRRIAEILGAAMPVLALLAAPIVLSVVLHRGELYRWAQNGTELEGVLKHHYLTVPLFVARLILYFAVWCIIGVWYWRQSILQDKTGDPALSARLYALSAPATVALAFTLTFASFDLLMSLDARWFSTMYGIYFFAGCAVSIFATLILVATLLESRGRLLKSVTVEHFHDLGKFLFGFTFFWGYIAYSQFMLLWYGNIPEETEWLVRRGTSSAMPNQWTPVVLILLFGHLLIPFVGLLSRHVKRAKSMLMFWAGWLLVMHWIDLYWQIMPEYDGRIHLGLIEALCFVGIGGFYLATVFWITRQASLTPLGDPRVQESLVFENI